MSKTFIVGLTGGLASGKSTVATIFASLGAQICDADALVRDLYQTNRAGSQAVFELFGAAVLADDGSVDRRALGDLVLAQPTALAKLNRRIHPLVHAEIRSWIDTLPPYSIAIVEAALMVETGSYRNYDALVVVCCKVEQQVQRAIARGLSEQKARSILRAQLDMHEKIKFADIVIDNSESSVELETKAKRAWREIGSLAQTRV